MIPRHGRSPVCSSIMRLEWGWDDVHGGFYDKGESLHGGEAFDKKRIWWTQAEGP